MRRTIYHNRFLVDQIMLNNTEDSKVLEILRRQKLLGTSGVISGLRITPFISSSISIYVSSGQAVLPNGEIVSLNSDVSNIPLADSTNGALNLALLTYKEEGFDNRINELGENESSLVTIVNPSVEVLTSDQYLALPISSSDPNVTTSENALILGIITARGVGVPLNSSSILSSNEDLNLTNFSNFELMKGVVIKSSTVENVDNFGTLRYDLTSRRLDFISPNNNSPFTSSFGHVIDRSQDVKDITLTDSALTEDRIVVDIYGTIIPTLASLDSAAITDFTNRGILTGNIVTENIDFSYLYNRNLYEIESDSRVDVPIASAEDKAHRELVGTGNTKETNPHGISLADLIKLFELIPGGIRIGDELISTPEEAVFSRIKMAASSEARYCLLWETEIPNQGAFALSPLRFYINSLDPSLDDDNLSETQLTGISITLNARFDPINNIWEKDNVGFSEVPAIKLELGSDSFNISMNQGEPSFNDPDGWSNKLLIDGNFSIIKDALAVFGRNNVDHNDAARTFAGLVNAAENSPSSSRPAKVCLYEDLNAFNGGLRIYLGNNQSTGIGDGAFEFYVNARPQLGQPITSFAGWEKDVLDSPSYYLRYAFATGQLEACKYEGSSSVFGSNFWEPQVVKIPGGFVTTDTVSSFRGSFVTTNLAYAEPINRVKVVPLSDIGFSVNQNYVQDIPGHGDRNGYFGRDEGNLKLMRRGVPHQIAIENYNKNSTQTSVPKYVWRGPERNIYRSDSENDFDGDLTIFPSLIVTSSGQVFKFTFPFSFEEQIVDIDKMSFTLDFGQLPLNEQTTNFNRSFGPDLDLRFNLIKLNTLTGDFTDLNPSLPDSPPPIRWESLGTGTPLTEQVVNIQNPSGDIIRTIDKTADDFGENDILQLELEINTPLVRVEVVSFRNLRFYPIIIGNLVIEYKTLYVE